MNTQNDSEASVAQYDSHITPAETAARQHREGEHFGHAPHDEANNESIQETEGYTVDREGLINNYAIEPEMYVNIPGDMHEQIEREKAERAHQLQELSEDEDGKLTMEHDYRHKGPGLI